MILIKALVSHINATKTPNLPVLIAPTWYFLKSDFCACDWAAVFCRSIVDIWPPPGAVGEDLKKPSIQRESKKIQTSTRKSNPFAQTLRTLSIPICIRGGSCEPTLWGNFQSVYHLYCRIRLCTAVWCEAHRLHRFSVAFVPPSASGTR